MNRYFPEDRYVTPPNAPTALLNRLLFGWSWAFYLQYIEEVFRARGLALNGRYDDEEWAASSHRVLRKIERNRGRFDIVGIDRLRKAADSAPFVFISNHMSTLETQILPVIIAPFMPVTFVVKERLVSSPVFGPVMRSRDPIAVKRKNPREDLETVLEEGRKRLERGVSIIIFPQSTRSPEFSRENFNTLGVKLAARTGVQAFPIAVRTDFWGEQGLFRGFGKVRPERTIRIEFGEPMPVPGRGREEHLKIVEFIESRQALWSAADREASGRE